MTGPHTVATDTVDLCTEAFGDPADPTVLLIMGASASMIRWDDRFCRRLAAGGRHVVRYDQRDVGRSTTDAPGQAAYTLEHLADDAVALLDHVGVERGHLVGASMGGMIAQLVALRHPARVATITAIMSTPDPSAATAHLTDGHASPLPPPTPAVLDRIARRLELDWTDDAAVVEDVVAMFRVLAGSRHPFDEAHERALATIELIRSPCLASSSNHGIAVATTPPWRRRLDEIACPTLVIHGTEDPILPFAHGQALAAEIRGARLLPLDGVGHELPMATWDCIVAAVLAHTSDGTPGSPAGQCSNTKPS
jgi:pimeloyl-ACP methyl ester carboxylesterase